ncbi:hypothetical protein BRLA_c029080 [Brevibacillus laterosporus LMG 15441]|uniref:Uncharacterized protein n=1 Tax=Brevibacillus laterosporus LMG 15441 TaxID=1042163 RepID=A0A075R3W0_BRELA|nr:hypothetical protein BRLA_c029080 [Brevibacillus laterosporus LMG 15441]
MGESTGMKISEKLMAYKNESVNNLMGKSRKYFIGSYDVLVVLSPCIS